jgi:lipoate-protein ligase A
LSVVAAAEQRWNEAALGQAVAAPAWRLWHYESPAVVLGRSQRAQLPALAAASGLPLLVRSSGGGPVLVGPWMLGLSAALPADHALAGAGPVDGYRWLGEGIAHALRDIGLADAVALAPQVVRACAPDPTLAWACFGGLSPWEVVVDGRKVVGLAQVRRRTGVLVVAGVLLEDPPWEQLCAALGQPPEHAAALRRATMGCAERLGRPAQLLGQAVAQRLETALTETLGTLTRTAAQR